MIHITKGHLQTTLDSLFLSCLVHVMKVQLLSIFYVEAFWGNKENSNGIYFVCSLTITLDPRLSGKVHAVQRQRMLSQTDEIKNGNG